MADCNDPFACAVRSVTRRCGRMIWSDPGRLRSRLQYEIGPVSAGQSEVLDALVIAAMQGIPAALVDHGDLEQWTVSLSEAVGPLLAAEALAVWTRAIAVPELECMATATSFEGEPVGEGRVPTLIEKLRPPPPVSVSP
jgi:hypothetical protein